MSAAGSRTAIVTGAGSGIGAAAARALAAAGHRVLLGHAPGDPREAETIAAGIRAAGGEARAHGADVAGDEQVADLLERCRESFGEPDVLVANAGVVVGAPLAGLESEDFERLLGVDLLGVHRLFRGGVEAMRERGWGRLLATTSTSGVLYGWDRHGAYCAAKAAVAGLVRAYAVEFGAVGITANAVAPGVIRTPQSLDPVDSVGEEGLAAVARLVPARRVGDPADVAAVFAFLAGDGAGYVNGQTIVVDGGLSVVEPI